MTYIGDFEPGQLVKWEETSKLDGVPTALLGSPAVTTYKATTTPSTTGSSITASYGGVTGLNKVGVDTSADATFFAAGNDFTVVLTAGTVGGISIPGTALFSFSIKNRSVGTGTGIVTFGS